MIDEKNWLIRTRAKQILGPVSKKKIIEFVEKGSLAPEDEITRGNGYWINVKERELLDKYLYGDVPMEFNPINEAKAVLINLNKNGRTSSIGPTISNQVKAPKDNNKLPENDDLAYPGDDSNQTDNTQFIKIPPKQATTDANLPDQSDQSDQSALSDPEINPQKKK